MRQDGILVVGGGIAGLTAAAALSQRGWSVDLIERRTELSDSGGAGLTLVANAVRALDSIGAAEPSISAGIPADSMAICRPDGSMIVEIPLPRIVPRAVTVAHSTRITYGAAAPPRHYPSPPAQVPER